MTATTATTTAYFDRTTEDLAGEYYEFHRATWGYKPHFDWTDRAYVIAGLVGLDKYHSMMRETFSGRETMRADGWVIAETDPALIQQAAWLAQERARQMAEWDAEMDAGSAVQAAEAYEDWA